MNALLAIASFALLASPDSGPGWTKAAETDGITVFTRDKPGSEVKELKALGTIDSPAEAVWKVIRDYAKYKERMPYTEVAEVVATEEGGKVTWFYSRIAAPFVAKRDYTLKIIDESDWKDGKGFLKSSWVMAPDKGPAPMKDVVRLKTNDGFWLLEPKDGGKRTFVTYYLFTDPGGSIPKFLVNSANSSAVPDVFRAIRKHATTSK
ncbi:MAG TPA: START domain-containing protein [Myxococcales bacterium]|nr:START domain-containing protein [Myxococcales bacterium]